MSTIFSKILSGEIPCHRIAENDRYFSFLDIRPVAPGHTLVIPKMEVDYFFDMDDALLAGIMQFARPIAKALAVEIPCLRVGVMVAGLEVPHAHMHLIPINAICDLNFSNAKAADHQKLAVLAARVRSHLE